jgi:predicted Zn-dependent protease with MMP-like domain
MKEISNDEFDSLITRAMDELPQEYIRGLDNVAIVMEDNPTTEQIKKMKIRDGTILLGLYEGIPLTQRGNGYTFVLPDKITLFKKSLLQVAQSEKELFYQVKQTLWHEIAHFYGLEHQQMDRLQNKKSSV